MSLILTRKPTESIHVGSNVIVTVVSVKGNQVRLAFSAPADVAILRSELVGVPRKIERAAS